MGGNITYLVYLTPHPRLWSSDSVQIMKMTFKCYISENDDNFLISRHFLLVNNNQSLKMPWLMGGGQPIPAGLSYPHPRLWSSDCVQIMKMTSKCYISENDENTLIFRRFLHVYNSQSLEMPWMTGCGQPIPAGLSYPPPMIVRAVTGYWFCYAVNCFNNYERICFTKYRY